jgi:hypothetical protein
MESQYRQTHPFQRIEERYGEIRPCGWSEKERIPTVSEWEQEELHRYQVIGQEVLKDGPCSDALSHRREEDMCPTMDGDLNGETRQYDPGKKRVQQDEEPSDCDHSPKGPERV